MEEGEETTTNGSDESREGEPLLVLEDAGLVDGASRDDGVLGEVEKTAVGVADLDVRVLRAFHNSDGEGLNRFAERERLIVGLDACGSTKGA